MYRLAVCDDVKSEREALKKALGEVFAERRESFTLEGFASAEALLEGPGGFDLVFLDIFMDGMTGMDAARRLRETGGREPIVFLTTSPDFAVESYDVEAAGYLLKPLETIRLRRLIDRLFAPAELRRIDLKCGRETVFVAVGEISFAESDAYRLLVHLRNGCVIETREKLAGFEKRLNDARFLRCHQSYLVNMDDIARAGTDFVLKTGETVPIRVRSHRDTVEKYRQYFLSRL